MFGLGGGMDPKKMQAMMKQLGIKQDNVEATRVIIAKEDGRIVIENPNVTKIVMQGQESWQVMGEAREEAQDGIREDDVRLVMDKTGASMEEAKEALEAAGGDLAEAITKLSE